MKKIQKIIEQLKKIGFRFVSQLLEGLDLEWILSEPKECLDK